MPTTALLPRLNSFDRPTPGTGTGTVATPLPQASWLGKYRVLIIAVAFFLVFDLAVLVLNFYTSFQISEDAVSINLAGRQRMLSQRTAKALLSVEAARTQAGDATANLQELGKAVDLFDTTLLAFELGGTVPGGDLKPVTIEAAQGVRAQAILQKAGKIWAPYKELLTPVLAGKATDAELQAAGNYARGNNLVLLGLMNELTTALEAVATERANTLRLVQTTGIVLALLNFGFILFKFLKQLRAADASVEEATEENQEILSSVREGLFLITPDYQLGTQVSASARAMFGAPLVAGDSFFEVLAPMVDHTMMMNARDYVGLLFSPHIKESLVQDINPLQQVQLRTKTKLGEDSTRQLSFHFNRVQDKGVVRHLLVTVQDVSDRKALEDQLKVERQQSQKEFGMLLKAFDTDPAMLRQFVARSEVSLLEINDLMRSISLARTETSIVQALDMAFRRAHAIKGDASTLGLQTLAEQAHAFESELQRIRDSGVGTAKIGEALLALPAPLEELLNKVLMLKNLTHSRKPGAGSLSTALSQLALTVASDTGKRIATKVRLDLQDQLPPRAQDLVREIAEQLIRNAVVHGIEPADMRSALEKPADGMVDAQLFLEADQWCLRVRDDGAGLSVAQIRRQLLDKSWYTEAQLESFSDHQIVAHIFKPGFSTQADVSMHAGRGVGLDVVFTNAQQLGARLQLNSSFGKFTEFVIRFEA